jgi:carboxylesterase type B
LDLWTNFAKSGVPAAGGLPTWPAYTVAEPNIMELRSDPQMVSDVRGDRIRALQAANEARAKAAKLDSR